jgi:hypothetical protein
MRIVAVGASHYHAAPLPPIQPLAVRPGGPIIGLGEMALGAEPVPLVQPDPVAGPERQHLDRIR